MNNKRICVNCGSLLATAIELGANNCFDCYSSIVSERDEYRKRCNELADSDKHLHESIAKLDAHIKELNDVIEAESLGKIAGERGADVSDNPYSLESQKNMKTYWEHGWYRSEVEREYKKLRAVMLWVMNSVAIVRQLLSGYGNDELASKLDTVIEKGALYLSGNKYEE